MPRRTHLISALIAAGLLATALPSAAQAATHQRAVVQGHAVPSAAPLVGKRVTGATTNGITPTFLPTYPANEGLTVSLDATKSTDSNTGATITGYSFDYGDGTSTSGNTTGVVTHTYAAPGTHTVTLTVTDSLGNTGTAAQSVTPAGTDYTPDGPNRILDTRIGTGAAKAKVANGGTVALKVTGIDNVPSTATAVVLNLTVTDAASGGYITAYPDGVSEPNTSNQNFPTGGTVADLITVKLGTDGEVDLTVNGTSATSVNLVGDLEGYYTPASADGYTAVEPGRIMDTRSGLNVSKAKVAEGKTATLTVDGAIFTTDTNTKTGNTTQQLPSSGITAVALNLTVTNTVESGVVTAYPDGVTLPTASNLNYSAGQTVANAAVVPVGADGKIDLSVTGNAGTSTDIIADVEGYYTTGNGANSSVFVPAVPSRLFDTSKAPCACPVPAGGYLHEPISAPATIAAYALNVTDASPAMGGNLAVYPDTAQDNITSTLNFNAGEDVGNYAQTTVKTQGLDIQNNSGGSVNIIVDEFGYFATS